jgi:hypothetical protein
VSVEITNGSTESIAHWHDPDGALVTGSTLRWWVRRASDGLVLNASNTFVTVASAGSGRYFALPELADLPGIYASELDTSLFTNALASDVYLVTIEETAPTARILATDEIRTVLIPAVWGALLSAHSVVGSFAELLKTTIPALPAAVWAVTDGTMTKGAALDLLRRRTTNKRLLSAIGVLSFYADNGTTVEKTSTVRDIGGTVVTPATGEASQASAEA